MLPDQKMLASAERIVSNDAHIIDTSGICSIGLEITPTHNDSSQ